MAFIDRPLPECIAFGAVAEQSWLTIVAENQSGVEQRTQQWLRDKMSYDIAFAARLESEAALLKEHFSLARGRLNTFLMKDFTDYEVLAGDGFASRTGAGTFQLQKAYGSGSETYYRNIQRPVSTGFAATRNGSPMTAGGGAGQYSLNTSTGILAVQPDQTRGINSHTVGSDHVFNLVSAFSPNVVGGNEVYVAGVTGTAASLLNGFHTVKSVAGAAVTIEQATTGLTASGGSMFRYIAASEIGWSGQFMVLVRYDMDKLSMQAVDRNGDELIISADGVRLVEVRP